MVHIDMYLYHVMMYQLLRYILKARRQLHRTSLLGTFNRSQLVRPEPKARRQPRPTSFVHMFNRSQLTSRKSLGAVDIDSTDYTFMAVDEK